MNEPIKESTVATIAVPVILVLYVLLTSFVTIGAGSIGVVKRFGKVTGREMSPGLNLKAPYPFESVWKADTRIQKEQVDAAAASTDLQDVSASLAVNYHLRSGSVSNIYKEVGTNYKDRIIAPAIQETFKAAAAQYTAAELIQKRAEVKQKALDGLRQRLEPRGIDVDDLSIVNFNFSASFNQAIEAKQVAQQNAEGAQFNLQQAQLDAQAQAVQKQSLSPELLQKYAIDKWNGQMPQYIGGGSVFNIPLVK